MEGQFKQVLETREQVNGSLEELRTGEGNHSTPRLDKERQGSETPNPLKAGERCGAEKAWKLLKISIKSIWIF